MDLSIDQTVSVVETLSRMLSMAQKQTEQLIEECPWEKRLFQIAPGKATPLWTIGHLGQAADTLGTVMSFGGAGIEPAKWRPLFSPEQFGGRPISSNPEDYPCWDEVALFYSGVMSQFIDQVSALSDDDLIDSPRGQVPEGLQAMAKSIQDTIMLSIFHDSHHRGQFALLINAPE